MNQAPCMPGETHPAYDGHRPAIVEWLDNPHHPYGEHMRIPFSTAWTRGWEPTTDAITLTSYGGPVIHMLTRRKAHAPAPYVGRPFVYQWYVGEDDLGRMVGGRTTWTRHTEGEAEYMIRTGDTDGPWSRLTRPIDGEPGWPVQAAP